MFATNEHRRFLKLYLVVENPQSQKKLYYALSKSKKYLHEMNQLLSYPTEARCQELASQMHKDEKLGKGQSIYIEVFSSEYENQDNVFYVVMAKSICSGRSENTNIGHSK